MAKIVGFDLGTNSIGVSVRNTSLGDELHDQLEYYSVDIFDSGVGKSKSGEYSYAAERSKGIRQRRLYDVRRRRRWETLKYLIQADCCPLSMVELEEWRSYDKSKGLNRRYPIDNELFMRWIRLDFDNDGVTDCSPYELRSMLVNRQFDFSIPVERYRFGRAIFHICQHRGFKSSKGETLAEKDITDDVDLSDELKLSEQKKSGELTAYMNEHGCKTVGEALYQINHSGIRIRASIYQVIRSQLKDEITTIFNFQDGLDINSELYLHLTSEQKHVGSIFYKNPLRSQKGLIGHCTLEPQKPRCPISHPEYEKYRALNFIANIRTRQSEGDEWKPLDCEMKHEVYHSCFISKVGTDFPFKRIREFIEKKLGQHLSYEGNKKGTINFKDTLNVSGCPVTARSIQLLGEDWQTISIQGNKERNSQSKVNPVRHNVTYNAEDIWHYCFTADEMEDVECFAKSCLHWDDAKAKQLVKLWSNIKQGYGMLSRKAMFNINRMLSLGFDNTDAILLAKIPDLVGVKAWENNEDNVRDILTKYTGSIKQEHARERMICTIVNSLIANYKSLPEQHIFAYKDVSYKLQQSDLIDVDNAIVDYWGAHTWEQLSADEQEPIIDEVRRRYQDFFATSKRDFCKAKRLSDYFADFLNTNILGFDDSKLRKLYHPSMSEFPSANQGCREKSEWRLGSPKLGGIRNPVALRTLHTLRRKVNAMLDAHIIDPDTTRVVIETTRGINDANMRWAIEQYQKKREEQHREIERIITELALGREVNETDIEKGIYYMEQKQFEGTVSGETEYAPGRTFAKDIKKYALWKEQGCMCLYTGKVISLADLFSDNKMDFEHTLPLSQSFDDSQANLTICDSHYNRAIKRNKMPSQLPNYSEDAVIDGILYTAILPRLEAWEKRVEKIKENVDFWRAQAKKAQEKSRKDQCIRQRHLWQMELDYWSDKLYRFKTKEIPQGFRNRQLADTGIISRYAVQYLKTIFDKVEVQKGEVTATFRKILGIQSTEEKKDRSLHSHHAIDATVLTLIPVAAKRERMMKLYYEKEEAMSNNEKAAIQRRLDAELESQNIGSSFTQIGHIITENILINHIAKDKSLIPSSKKVRSRGKEVQYLQADGTLKGRVKRGDAIRGNLHKDTFYGAITQNKQNVPFEEITVSDISFVCRRKLEYANDGFKTWDDVEKVIVDKSLFQKMKAQFPEGTSFKDASAQGIYAISNDGKTHGCPIRHIRCYASTSNPIRLKKNTYSSQKPYKNYSYVASGDLVYLCCYENDTKREFVPLSLYEVTQLKKSTGESIPKEYLSKKGVAMKLRYCIKAGSMILLYNNNPEELKEMSPDMLMKRLYVVQGFEGDSRITLKHHLCALSDNDVPNEFKKGANPKKVGIDSIPKIRCVASSIKFLLKGDKPNDGDFWTEIIGSETRISFK